VKHATTARCAASCAGLLAPAAEAAGAPAGQALEVLLGLAVVIALIFACAWLSRRLQLVKPASRGRIRVLETLPLGARERLLLIEVDDTRVLVATCPGRIATLHAFDAGRPDFVATLAAAEERAA